MSLLDFDAPPDSYAVMGNPIAHSKSPTIHQLFAKQTGQRLAYQAILVDLGGLENAVGNFVGNQGKGLNITVPFKEDAYRLATTLSKRARRAEAVNTLKFNADGSLYGDNTDGVGLVRDLTQNHGLELENKKILILGAGGAVKGMLEPIMASKPDSIVIANRTVTKAERLAIAFEDMGTIRGCGYEMLNEMGGFDLIINGTAASLKGELPPVPESVITPESVCYDLMYATEPTSFMQWCLQLGAHNCVDGLGMLVEQAAESFFLWRGIYPDTASVIEKIRSALIANY
jgi:shikimate dehydrogenase